MRKGTSALQNLQLLKWCTEYGIVAYWNLLYGFPGENPADYDAMASIIEFIHHLRPPHAIGPIRLDRFSPNFFNSAALGVTNVRPDRNYRHIYDLADEELYSLAYFFEHDYEDGRNPESYIGNARTAVLRWHQNSGNQGLKYVDHGDNVAIWDLRPNAKRTLTILTGHERAVFLYCDQHRSLPQIESFLREIGGAVAPIQPFLDNLVNHRLMIYLDKQYLSLAVRAARDAAERAQASPTASMEQLVVV
jgi:hypothetical protein